MFYPPLTKTSNKFLDQMDIIPFQTISGESPWSNNIMQWQIKWSLINIVISHSFINKTGKKLRTSKNNKTRRGRSYSNSEYFTT